MNDETLPHPELANQVSECFLNFMYGQDPTGLFTVVYTAASSVKI
jgi:hypothetical protein